MQNIPQSELTRINNKIAKLLLDVKRAVDWSDKFLKSDIKERTQEKTKKIRRELKKIQFAITQNPSAALYGESQVGKSYLIKNLLSKSKEPFTITDKSTGEQYDFLEEINPKGDQTEATSVVTRFSTNVKIIDTQFPIKIRLLSPKDIVLFLCDSYFSDVIDHQSFVKTEDIDKHMEMLEQLFDNSDLRQDIFTEDDVYDIRDYLEQYFKGFTLDLVDSKFWNFCASNIHKVDYSNWHKLFEIIWHQNVHINKIFSTLIDTLNKVEFSSVVYAEFKAVLRKHGTLLHVARLRELNGEPLYEDVPEGKFISDVDIIYENKSGNVQRTAMDKSLLCALVAELIFEVNKELEEHKPFLKSSDLLDFPGARSRLKNQESKLSEAHIGNMVLRGKVSYIFNKYSSQYLISNLLFCNKNAKIEVKYIPKLLNTWIENYIGKNPVERQEFLSNTPVPPLFIIYTFFNEDIKYNPINDREDNLDEKWIKRFKTIFENEIVTEDFDWHVNWTTNNSFFQNNYMLRDFHYSDTIYKGFGEFGEEKELVPVRIKDYFDKLKQSFINFEFVKNHFTKPIESWDEAASMTKDGSVLILNNLTKVSNNISRTQKFVRVLNCLSHDLNDEMKKHYHSDESDKRIKRAAENAGHIHLNMDIVFGRDPYAFGKFIKYFIIKEADVYNEYHNKLSEIELIKNTNFDDVSRIRFNNPELSPKKDYEENIAVLVKGYKFLKTTEEVEEYFSNQNIDLHDLFYGERDRIKSNSLVLAQELKDFWFENYLNQERFEPIIQIGFSVSALEDLFENIRVSFEKHDIAKKIAEKISSDVDKYDRTEDAKFMIADISARMINKFITSLGWDFYSNSEIENLIATNEANALELNFDLNGENLEVMNNTDISDLFDNMHKYNEIINQVSLDHAIVKNFPNIRNLTRWRNLLKISFIANCDIPTYDIMANNALGDILGDLSTYNFEIKKTEKQ